MLGEETSETKIEEKKQNPTKNRIEIKGKNKK